MTTNNHLTHPVIKMGSRVRRNATAWLVDHSADLTVTGVVVGFRGGHLDKMCLVVFTGQREPIPVSVYHLEVVDDGD